jgi:hypothetical protein
VHVKPGYDRHQGLLRVPALATTRTISRRAEGGPVSSCHLCAMSSNAGDGRGVGRRAGAPLEAM